MPLFLVQTRKATQLYGGRKWSNQYFTNKSTVTAALAWGYSVWVSMEKAFHYDDIYCYEIYVNEVGDAPYSVGYTDAVVAADAYGTLSASAAGQKSQTFVTLRVDFPVTASRPSRKFYRPVLRESDYDGDNLSGAFATIVNAALGNIPSIGGFYDVDGQVWIGSWTLRGLTSRRMGKLAALAVPSAP